VWAPRYVSNGWSRSFTARDQTGIGLRMSNGFGLSVGKPRKVTGSFVVSLLITERRVEFFSLLRKGTQEMPVARLPLNGQPSLPPRQMFRGSTRKRRPAHKTWSRLRLKGENRRRTRLRRASNNTEDRLSVANALRAAYATHIGIERERRREQRARSLKRCFADPSEFSFPPLKKPTTHVAGFTPARWQPLVTTSGNQGYRINVEDLRSILDARKVAGTTTLRVACLAR